MESLFEKIPPAAIASVAAIGFVGFAYFMLTIEVYLATYTIGTFHLSFWKFSPTELRILLMIGNVALFWRPWVRLFGESYRLFDVGGVVGIAGLSLMVITSSIRHAIQLYRDERLP